ncbi:MAG: hypothetical protein K2M43_03135, partial [Mycoplasmoidaceae bacterium]|nr:hypothetical protein [Mycoplasmoidaceae bacterium]
MVSFLLGAGRISKEAPIDFNAGVYLDKVINQKVSIGDTVATLYSSKPIPKELIKRFQDNIAYSKKRFKKLPNIVKVSYTHLRAHET